MIGIGVNIWGGRKSDPHVEATKAMAAYYTDEGLSALEVWMGDSRSSQSVSLQFAENAPDLRYNGFNLGGSVLNISGVSDTAATVATANQIPTNTKISPVDWDMPGWVTEFLGGTSPATDLGTRILTGAFSGVTYPNLWARFVGLAVRIRGFAYAPTGKAATSPDLQIWVRNSPNTSVTANSPRGSAIDVSALSVGQYGVSEAVLPVGWTSSDSVQNISWNTVKSAGTTAGELMAPMFLQLEAPGGVSIHNRTLGGERADLHWAVASVVPDAWFNSVLPLIAEGRQVIARIDIGTNFGDLDSDYIENVHTMISRIRNVFPDAIVGIFTAFDSHTDTSNKTYVGWLYDAFNAGAFSNAYFIDSRAGLDTYPVALAAGYMGDTVHRSAAGNVDVGQRLNTWITQMRTGGNYACRITTSLVANPYTHGVAGTIAGNCYPPTATIQVLNNAGDVIATTAGVNGAWSTSITLPSAGAQNISARCPNGFTTKRPTVVA